MLRPSLPIHVIVSRLTNELPQEGTQASSLISVMRQGLGVLHFR